MVPDTEVTFKFTCSRGLTVEPNIGTYGKVYRVSLYGEGLNVFPYELDELLWCWNACMRAGKIQELEFTSQAPMKALMVLPFVKGVLWTISCKNQDTQLVVDLYSIQEMLEAWVGYRLEQQEKKGEK